MIPVQVQFEQHGDLHGYLAPDIVERGDRVIVEHDGTLAVATVVAIGGSGAGEEIIRVIGPAETMEQLEPGGGGA